MPESNDVCRRRPLLLIFLLVFSIIPFGTTSAWTPPSPGTVETFDDGNTTIETMFPSAGVFRPTNFSIPRNTTVTAASFNLDVNGSSTDVGPTRIDIGEDGNIEWAFEEIGYGSLGVQRSFVSGADYQVVNITPTSHVGASFYAPSSAIPSDFSLNLSYQTSGFSSSLPVTNFSRIVLGDISGDGTEDVLALVTNTTVWNGTKNWQQRAVKWLNSSANHNSSSLSFETIPICNGTDEIIPANLSGDARKEIIGLSTTNSASCVVEWNGTAWEIVDERVLTVNASAWLTIDHNRDGQEQLLLGNTTTTTGYGMGGSPNLYMYNWSNATNQLSMIAQVVADHTLTGGTTTLSGLAYGNFYAVQPTQNGLLAVSDRVNQRVKFYDIDPSIGVLMASNNPAHLPFTGISSNLRSGNLDADPWDDLYGSNGMTSCFAFWDPMAQAFTTVNQTGIDLKNATLDDHNHTGRNQMYVPSKGTPDGNPATMDGALQVWDLPNTIGQITENSTTLNPHTAPLHVLFADVNGDGGTEHVTISAEGSFAIHIKHHAFFGIDIDSDMIPDVKDMSYAPDGVTTNLWAEFNDSSHASSVRQLIQLAPVTSTGYGYDMSLVEINTIGTGMGSVNASNLFIPYEAEFNVSINPGVTTTLASALNLEMEIGANNISVPIPITVGRPGNLTFFDPYISYILGAPQSLSLPEPPQMVLVDNLWNATLVEWTSINLSSSGGLIFTYFEIQVTKNNTSTAYVSEYENLNNTLDVDPESNYSIRIRTVFEGIRTNWSAWLNYTTPEQPDTFPPPLVNGLVARDHPRDNGDGIDIQFRVNSAPDAHTYFVYVSESSDVFTTSPWSLSDVMAINHSLVENNTHVNLTVYTTSAILNETGAIITPSSSIIPDNSYYVAVITNDTNDNRLFPPANTGPVTPRSDMVNGTLDVRVIGSVQQPIYSWNAFSTPASHPTLRVKIALDEQEHSLNRTIRLLSARPNTCVSLCINELMANPSGSDKGIFPNGEWVELYNPGPNSIDLENWTLEDKSGFIHPIDENTWIGFDQLTSPYILDSGAYALISENLQNSLKLNNAGETLYLKNETGSEIDNITTGQSSEGVPSVPNPSGPAFTWVDGAESTPGGPDAGTTIFWTKTLNQTGVLEISLDPSTAYEPLPFGHFGIVILIADTDDEATGRNLHILSSDIHFNRTLDAELFISSMNPHQLVRGTTSDIVVGVRGDQNAEVSSSLAGQILTASYSIEGGGDEQIQSSLDATGRVKFAIPENARNQAQITFDNPPTWLQITPTSLTVTLIEAQLELITTPELQCPVSVWEPTALLQDESSQQTLTCKLQNMDDIAYSFTLVNNQMVVATDGTITASTSSITLPSQVEGAIDIDFELDTPLAGIMVDEQGLWTNFTFTLNLDGPYHVSREIDYTIQVHVSPPELAPLYIVCDMNVSALSGESIIQDLACTIVNTNGVSVVFTGRPSGIVGTPSAHVHSSLPIGVILPPGYPGITLVLKISVPTDTTIMSLPVNIILESRATGWISVEQTVELTIEIVRPIDDVLIEDPMTDTNSTTNSNQSDGLADNVSLNNSGPEVNESGQINASASVSSASASQSIKVAGIGMASLIFILIGLSALLNSFDKEEEYDEDDDENFGSSYIDFDDMDVIRSSQSLTEAKKNKDAEKPIPVPDVIENKETGGDARARLARRSQKARETRSSSISENEEAPVSPHESIGSNSELEEDEHVEEEHVEEEYVEEEYTEDEYAEEEEAETEVQEDGDDIILDEDGVEWWEDEDGTWYFRDEAMDDWEVFEGDK